MAQAAATPKTRFSGTAMPAVSRESLMAAIVSALRDGRQVGSPAFFEGLHENGDEWQNDEQSHGRQRENRQAPTHQRRIANRRKRLFHTSASMLRPRLHDVDAQQQNERSYQHDHGDGGRARIVVLLRAC